ncbi:MAG: glucose 1-dehydrogenase [Erysipelotrichaceae bacterium]|nr:glucose 1-dehydrogenase [Erysipelotrichaceae bacterium]
MRLEGKVAVVTGASSGMGKEIVKLYVAEGAKVVAFARREERLVALGEEVKDYAGEYAYYAGDVSKREDTEGAIDYAVEKFGKIDILVNNAGVMDDMSPIAQATDEKYEQVFAINVYGPMATMRKACQVFLAQGNGGSIINISSVGSMHQAAGPIYGASKAALNAMSRNTAYVYEKEGIRCNVIAPGGFATEIGTSMGRPNMDGYQKYAAVIGLAANNQGDPKEIANACLFLGSDEAKFISGVVLPVDGGWMSF